MALILDIFSWLCLLGGVGFCLLGGIGLLRFPDIFARTHAIGLIDTMGAGLIILGLLLQAPGFGVVVKLVFVAVFLWITSPTATHATIQAAYARGLNPLLGSAPNPLQRGQSTQEQKKNHD